MACPIPLKTSEDVFVLIELYKHQEPGVGLGRMLDWVKAAPDLPYEVRRKFLYQFATGKLYSEDFL